MTLKERALAAFDAEQQAEVLKLAAEWKHVLGPTSPDNWFASLRYQNYGGGVVWTEHRCITDGIEVRLVARTEKVPKPYLVLQPRTYGVKIRTLVDLGQALKLEKRHLAYEAKKEREAQVAPLSKLTPPKTFWQRLFHRKDSTAS